MTLEDLVLSIGALVEAGRAARCPVCRTHGLTTTGCASCGSELGTSGPPQ